MPDVLLQQQSNAVQLKHEESNRDDMATTYARLSIIQILGIGLNPLSSTPEIKIEF